MREFVTIDTQSLELKKVVCNQCGKELTVEEGIVKEGCFHADYSFDYFSNKDGYIYSLDLCEACFDRWVKGFCQPVQIREMKEYI